MTDQVNQVKITTNQADQATHLPKPSKQKVWYDKNKFAYAEKYRENSQRQYAMAKTIPWECPNCDAQLMQSQKYMHAKKCQ